MSYQSLEKRTLNDLYTYSKEVCGFKDLNPGLHGEICEKITDAFVKGHHHQAILIPRYFLKSSLGVATVSWMFTRKAVIDANYEWRTLIDTSTLTLSSKHLNWIARTLSANRTYRRLFGNFYDRPRGGMNREIYVTQREKKDGIFREPNFMASAVRAEVTGLHFDVHWYDDLVSERNWYSKTLRQTVTQHFYSSLNLLASDGLILYTATPWHDGDLTGTLVKAEEQRKRKNEQKFFHFYKRYAMEDENRQPDENHGHSVFPNLWPDEALADKKRSMPKYLWRAQMMMDPSAPEDAIPFDKSTMYAPYSSFPPPSMMRLRVVTVDPNFRNEDQAAGDYACIIVGAFDYKGNWWGMDVRMGQWRSEDFIKQLFDVNRTWRPHIFRMEKKFTSHLMTAIRSMETMEKEYLPITFIERDWRSKEMRYAGLNAIFASRRVKFNEAILPDVKEEMEEELERVGASAHDDFLDPMMDQFTGISLAEASAEMIAEAEGRAMEPEEVAAASRRVMITPTMMGLTQMNEPADEPEKAWYEWN